MTAQTLDTFVVVNNHKLHFNIIPGHRPPILFESGNGDDGSVWAGLTEDIHQATGATIITYDRAGLGKSTIDTTTIGFQQEVRDVKKALQQLGFADDFFLVAHSFGGFYATEFAQSHPGKIKGAVFIDVSTPCNLNAEYASRVNKAISTKNWGMLKQYKLGLYYVLKEFPQIAQYMADRYIPSSIPLTVIVADNYRPSPQIGETKADMINWQNCLRSLGNQPNHKYVTTSNTDHKVWEKAPEVVVEEIVGLYNTVVKD